MTQEHPITPPPKLVEQWNEEWVNASYNGGPYNYIAIQAARWGADQELDACCEWLTAKGWILPSISNELRAARRPKPPSLKEQALQVLANAGGADHPVVATVLTADQHALIRKALEQLDD